MCAFGGANGQLVIVIFPFKHCGLFVKVSNPPRWPSKMADIPAPAFGSPYSPLQLSYSPPTVVLFSPVLLMHRHLPPLVPPVQDVEPESNSLPACPAPSPKGQPGTLSPPSPPIRDQVYTLSIPPTCPVYSLQGSSTPVSSTSLPRGLASLQTAHTSSSLPLLEPPAPTMCPVPVKDSQCSDVGYKKLGLSLQHLGQLEQVFLSPV